MMHRRLPSRRATTSTAAVVATAILVVLICFFADSTHAQQTGIALVAPPSRGGATVVSTTRQGVYLDAIEFADIGCGGSGSQTIRDATTPQYKSGQARLAAGTLNEIQWLLNEVLPEGTNRLRISVLYNKDSTFIDHVLTDTNRFNMDVGSKMTSLIFPDKDCTRCTTPDCVSCILQVMVASSAHGGVATGGSYWLACSDIEISGASGNTVAVVNAGEDQCQDNSGCSANRPVCDTTAVPKMCIRSTPLSCLTGFITTLNNDVTNVPTINRCDDASAIFCKIEQFRSKLGLTHLTTAATHTHYSCARQCTAGEVLGAQIPNDVTGASADITTSCCEADNCNTKALGELDLARSSTPCEGGCGINGACNDGLCVCDIGFIGTSCQNVLSKCDANKKKFCNGNSGFKTACDTLDRVSGCKWCKLPYFKEAACVYAPNDPCVDDYSGQEYNVGGGGCQPTNAAGRLSPPLLSLLLSVVVAVAVTLLL
jgi:hypothetical protein